MDRNRPAQRQSDAENEEPLAGGVLAAAAVQAEPDSRTWLAPVVVFAVLFALGFLMVGASAVPPHRIRWAAVAEPLLLHRSDLMALGIGAIALALVCLNLAVFF